MSKKIKKPRPKDRYQRIQEAITAKILTADFEPPVPCLDKETWNRSMDWTSKKNKARLNTLEWLGDSLMDAAISLELYRQVPNGNQFIFSVVRPRLVTNETFALLMHKLNDNRAVCAQTAYLDPSSKTTADVFEVVAAELCISTNFETLTAWVGRLFQPLIEVAIKTCFELMNHFLGKRKRPGLEENIPKAVTLASAAESSGSVRARPESWAHCQVITWASAGEPPMSVSVEGEKAKDRHVFASTSVAEATAMATPPRQHKRRKITHDTSDINVTSLSDPFSSLPATQGSSGAGRSSSVPSIAEPDPKEIATRHWTGPGSSQSNPIFVDSDLEDTLEYPCSTCDLDSESSC